MGIVISCFAKVGGTGISNDLFHTARAAYRTGALDAVICYGNRQSEIPSDLIRPIRFQPARMVSFLKARYYYTLKRMAIDRRATRHIRRHGCDIFHSWTTECIHSLEEAKRIGAKTIVERPAPHPATVRRILREEYERRGVPLPRDDGNRWLRRIDWAHRDSVVAPIEFSLADLVVVQSEFCFQSFIEQGFPPGKMVILRRAVGLKKFPQPAEPKENPFRVLFVGTVSLRKGFLDLLRAWTELALPGGELWVVGAIHDEVVPFLGSSRDDPSIRFFGHVREWSDRFYSASTVFVLPSLIEGSANTNFEAMAAGLPVITTLNAGSAVRDGIDGFIVPIRDPDAIKERLLLLYENREMARAMGKSGQDRVAESSWETYENRVISIYGKLLGRNADT